jgi:hypothetical protein
MKQRCTNPKDKGYKNYGGRGVEFRFASPLEAGLWIQANLGLDKEKSLDRIDNNGHYEPGNLRWATNQKQSSNKRVTTATAKRFCELRVTYPEVRYADSTARCLLKSLTVEQVVDRWHNLKSCKPKGVYGTCSTPDQGTVSLLMDG